MVNCEGNAGERRRSRNRSRNRRHGSNVSRFSLYTCIRAIGVLLFLQLYAVRAVEAFGFLTTKPKKPTFVLQGLLADTMTEDMLRTVISLCRAKTEFDVKIFVIMPLHFAIEAGEMLADEALDSCFHIIPEDEEQTASISNRIERLAYLRDAQRDFLLESEVVKPGDLVGVMDFDFKRFMEVDHFFDMARESQRRGDYFVMCSNGFEETEEGHKVLYDTFPLAFLDKSWAWKLRMEAQPDPTPYYYQKILFEKFSNATLTDNRVLSCFGGAAIYPEKIWRTQGCGYQKRNETTEAMLKIYAEPWPPYSVCEHLRFNQCLFQTYKNLTFAIDGRADIEREFQKRLSSL